MAEIGNLGELITFQVSSKKVLTFHDMQRNVKGKWVAHDVIGKKPKSEFIGPDLQQVTLPIFLSSVHRVKPRKTIERIEKAVEKGTPFTFVIGGKKVGKHQWVIENMSDTWGEIIEDGRLVAANITLTLREYV
jgi:phage protein U